MVTKTDTEAMASEKDCREAAAFMRKWLKENPSEGFGCVFNMWDILGSSSYMAKENAQDFVDFFLHLLTFLSQPKNVKLFEEACEYPPPYNYGQMLFRLTTGFINMGRKTPQAELHAYALEHFPDYRIHQLHSIYNEYDS